MAYSTILKPSDYFNTKLWTGNSTNSTAITGVGFQPDMTWIKNRSQTDNHNLFDAIRGATYRIYPDDTSGQDQATNSLASFDSDGFTLNDGGPVNGNGENIVGWNWKANGVGSSNSDGSTTATVSVNTTSGFSMVYYNTGGSGTQSMGHGLGSAPELIITKPTQNTESWYVYSETLTNSNILKLNATDASSSSGVYAYAPTASVFSVSNSAIGGYTGVMSYCFKSIKGFSKFGSYSANNNVDGPFIYTGFAPAFVMIKMTNGSDSWFMYDNKRSPFNVRGKYLVADGTGADSNADAFDFLSNGFKIRTTASSFNGNGAEFIYMAFAENPFVANVDGGLPVTAR